MENLPVNIINIGMWMIGILLSIIGFFLIFYFKRSVTSNDKLNESVNKLQMSVTGLNATLLYQDDKLNTFTKSCKEKHLKVDQRLEKHEEQLDRHEKDITVLKTKI